VTDERTAIVAAGYDAIADRYAEWSARIVDPGRDRMLGELMGRLSPGADVLDLGCGSGIPSTRLLGATFRVTGVDMSAAQIAAARRNVPWATFLQADMTAIELEPASFDAVTAFYALSHLPRELHGSMLARIATWLRRGGLLLATLGARDAPDWTGEWLGTRMFFSAFDADTNRALVERAGFELLVADVLETLEPEGPVPFLWVLARRAGASDPCRAPRGTRPQKRISPAALSW
jgi:SAM-dependent methyltransferase